jgi:hypothetical protein
MKYILLYLKTKFPFFDLKLRFKNLKINVYKFLGIIYLQVFSFTLKNFRVNLKKWEIQYFSNLLMKYTYQKIWSSPQKLFWIEFSWCPKHAYMYVGIYYLSVYLSVFNLMHLKLDDPGYPSAVAWVFSLLCITSF